MRLRTSAFYLNSTMAKPCFLPFLKLSKVSITVRDKSAFRNEDFRSAVDWAIFDNAFIRLGSEAVVMFS
jgi:hypothetical protein